MAYLDSQVAGNNRPLYPEVDHYWFKVAHNYDPLAFRVGSTSLHDAKVSGWRNAHRQSSRSRPCERAGPRLASKGYWVVPLPWGGTPGFGGCL